MVEGEFDALSVLQVGGTAIALGSVSNKNRLLDYLRTKNIKPYLLLALDNDDAGRVASRCLLEELTEMGINAEEINISGKYKDPNEALVNSPEEFHAIVNNPYARLHSAKHRLVDFMNGIAESVNTPAISTGFPRLDEFLNGGLYEGLYILGAISSAGKTAFVLQMADEIAKGGGDVLYFSLEMSMNNHVHI
ncbi:hypothetical protein FACS1894122_07820 [Alphaproteobacteria bacterium]|nr:hypothetical protein FACS1894122_07820 [Alphaproteobacteria bacterium]